MTVEETVELETYQVIIFPVKLGEMLLYLGYI